MRVTATYNDFEVLGAMPMTAPSPLVGEGMSAGRSRLSGVRGSEANAVIRKSPLTRRRFASAPSPTKGEGKRGTARSSVMRGLDPWPRIHLLRRILSFKMMDCRVKPGNDNLGRST